MNNQSDDLASDILRGCPAIAEYIGLPERQTFYILQRKLLPAWKEGKFWVSTKSRLNVTTTSLATQPRASTSAVRRWRSLSFGLCWLDNRHC